MPSTFFYILATLLLSLNFIRPLGLAISDWLYFGALFSAIFETLISKKNLYSTLVPRNIFFWPALLITMGAVISLANSKNIPVAIVELVQYLYIITVFISLTWIMVKRGHIEKIITFFIISGVFTSFIAAIDHFIGINYGPILTGTPQIQWLEDVSLPIFLLIGILYFKLIFPTSWLTLTLFTAGIVIIILFIMVKLKQKNQYLTSLYEA